jgi:hypothetical protein
VVRSDSVSQLRIDIRRRNQSDQGLGANVVDIDERPDEIL